MSIEYEHYTKAVCVCVCEELGGVHTHKKWLWCTNKTANEPDFLK